MFILCKRSAINTDHVRMMEIDPNPTQIHIVYDDASEDWIEFPVVLTAELFHDFMNEIGKCQRLGINTLDIKKWFNSNTYKVTNNWWNINFANPELEINLLEASGIEPNTGYELDKDFCISEFIILPKGYEKEVKDSGLIKNLKAVPDMIGAIDYTIQTFYGRFYTFVGRVNYSTGDIVIKINKDADDSLESLQIRFAGSIVPKK